MMLVSVAVFAPLSAVRAQEVVQPIPPGASAAAPQGIGNWKTAPSAKPMPPVTVQAIMPTQPLSPGDSSALAVVSQWRALQQSDGLGFSAYASFLLAYPGWPGEDRMRRLAESSISVNGIAPVLVSQFFTRYPPRTATGYARFASALAVLGKMGEARDQARNAWRAGNLAPADEAQILGLFGPAFTKEDYAAHVDALLWQGQYSNAERFLVWLSADQQQVAQARIAMQRGDPDALTKMQAADPLGDGDPGWIVDKVAFLRDQGNLYGARSALARRRSLLKRPVNPEKWFETLLSSARAAVSDNQSQLAYDIASRIDDAYDPGVEVRNRPIGERDDYTSLAWLAGQTAFYQLKRSREAVGMFERYATAARSPQTISKGYYWAGRAALNAGDAGLANRYFSQAAAYPDQFHGQLALERLGRPVPSPGAFGVRFPEVSAAEREAFNQRTIVRAARALGAIGLWQDQSQMIRAIAAGISDEKERVLAIELSRSLGRIDLGVMVGRRAQSTGQSGYSESSFPVVAVPPDHVSNWTMIHAISRQESQFDKTALSRAGARGLMQLMPGTARGVATKLGIGYAPGLLTTDPLYNIQLGSTYFQQMLSYYNGSYVLAVAAYNAGPGNVNKWLASNGDPRLPGADILKWIEDIPLSETRGYVMRVLENAVVYDTIRPQGAQFGTNVLSRYLGKSTPG